MQEKKRLYLAYGSNMNLKQMAHRCPTARVVGTAALKNYELLFRGNRSAAVATVEPKEGSHVPVLIWTIEPRDEIMLDLYEGYPNFYEKKTMQIELEGKRVSAMAYVMTPGHEYGVPSRHYLDTIREGYQSFGIDEQVLDDAVENAVNLTGRHQENPWQEMKF